MANTVRESKTILSAEDRTGGAFASMRREMEATQQKVMEMQAAVAGLAGVFVGGAFALAMKKAIDDMAAFKDMAIDAGVQGAANIQQFERAFRMANVPMGDAVGIMQKLSKSSLEVKDPMSNAALAVRALGISTDAYARMKPDEMLIAVAQASAKFAPSAEKNAVMMELMGKSGASAQKVLAEIAAQTPIVSKLMNEQAEAADALQDKFTGIQMKGEAFGRAGASVLVPTLSNILDAFIELRGEKDGSLGFFEAIGGAMKIAAGTAAALWIGIKDLGDAIGAFLAKSMQTDLAGFEAIEKARAERRAQNIAQLSDLFANLNKVETAATAAGTATGNIDFNPEAAKRARELAAEAKKLNEAAGKLLIDQGAKRTVLQDELDMNRKLTDGEKLLVEIQRGKYKQYGEGVENALRWEAQTLDAIQKSIDLRNERIKVNEQEVALRMSEQEAIAKTVANLEDENEKYEFETSLMGLNNKEREIAILLRAREAALSGDLTDMQRRAIENLYEERRQLLENRAVITDQQDAFKSMYDIIEGGFKASLQGAKSFGDYIKNGLKNALYELVARPFIVQIAAMLTGGGGGGGAGGIGNLLSAGMNLFGLGGSTSALAGIGGSLMNGLSTIGMTGTSQFVGGLTGAISGPGLTGAAGAGSNLGGMLSTAGPYIAAALAAYQLYQSFRDKGENPKYRLGFGSAAQGYASDSIFGMQGFQYAQGNDAANQGFRNFQRGLGGLDTQIGGLLTPAQIAAAAGRLNGTTGREFSFPKGDPTASEQLSKEFLQIKYSAVFADFNKGISDAIKNFAGNSEELIKYIGEQVTAYQQLQTMLKEIDNTIAGLSNNGVEALTRTLQSLADNVTSAQEALADARELNDPTKEVAAQKALMDAILNRYNTESKLIQDLADQLASIQSGAFDFGQQMAQRISSVGGDLMRFQDVPGMSKIGRLVNTQTQSQLGRITTLQGQIGGESDPSRRLGLINSALSVVDQYVSTGQAEIRARYDALSRGQQDSVRLQQDALTKRIQGLQTELDLVSQMQGIADSARAAIKAISFSGQNPGSAFARYGMQGDDIAALQNTFRNTTGNQRAGAASSLIQAIQGRLGSAGDLFQRPSDEYLAAYNEAMAALSEVQSAAQSDAERALELQASIEALTLESNGLTQNLVDYTALMNDALDAFNAQALGFYTDLGQQGTDTYALLEATGQAQLDVATRGLTVAEAQRGLLTEIRNLLSSINDGSGTATIGNGRKPAIDGGTLILRIDGRDIEGVIVDTVRSNRRVINEALSQT